MDLTLVIVGVVVFLIGALIIRYDIKRIKREQELAPLAQRWIVRVIEFAAGASPSVFGCLILILGLLLIAKGVALI